MNQLENIIASASTNQENVNRQEKIVTLLTEVQPALRTHLKILLGNAQVAENVLQETNLVIWRKAESFEIGTNFSAWARKIASYQAKAYIRDTARDPHVFGEEVVSELQEHGVNLEPESDLVSALRECLSRFSESNRQLLSLRYVDNLRSCDIALRLNASETAIRSRLSRLRTDLRRCVESRLKSQSKR